MSAAAGKEVHNIALFVLISAPQWCCACVSGVQAVVTATRAGVAGGLAVLSALERGPLQCILLQGLPSQGGFLAAYSGALLIHCATAYFAIVGFLK